jgi:integrase
MAQKRRKEIIKLRIEDINFEEKFVSYTEVKNSSKGSGYIIQKAFYITAPMETFLRRVIGNRKSGLLFPAPKALRKSRLEEAGQLNGDHLSLLFKTICKKYTKKDIHLHNLRHTATDILEKAGLTAQDIDYCLGHYSVNTSLKNYQDRSRDAVARRISKLTEKGIEILSKTVESLI